MVVWAALWVAAVVFHDHLESSGRAWWLWTPPIGIALGLSGLWYLHGRRPDEP
jgi:hypothetical protein